MFEDEREQPNEWLTKSALERIISAPVSKKFSIPPNLNRSELWADLRSIPGLAQSRRHTPFYSARIKLIGRAAKQARSLRDFIQSNGLKRELNSPFIEGSTGIKGLDELIRALEAVQRVRLPPHNITFKAKRGPQMPAGSGLRFVRIERDKGSSFEWLVGKHLPEIFHKHFNRKAGASRDPYSSGLDGPYIRFAEQVLQEAQFTKSDGSFFSRESIARALGLARSGESRHKLKNTVSGQN